MTAAEQLESQGIKTRVVSMPSWELFDNQGLAYQESVLPADVPRLAIEAGVTLAWKRYLDGSRDLAIGVDHYGASAPYKEIYEHYGLTLERVVEVAKKIIG